MGKQDNDFTKADNTFPIQDSHGLKFANPESVQGEILPPDMNNVPRDMMEHREQLLRKYHGGEKSLSDKLKKEGRNDLQSLVAALLDEMMEEGDSLQGNKLIALQSGQLRDATIISDKRAGVIEKIIKAVQAKQEFEKERGDLDLDSPALRIIFTYFMGKSKQAFKQLHLNDEQSDIFFTELAKVLSDWKKELKEEFDRINNTLGGQPHVKG